MIIDIYFMYMLICLISFALLLLEGEFKNKSWTQKQWEIVQASKTVKDEAAVKNLAITIHILEERQRNGESTPDVDGLFAAAKEALTQIPGYADTLVQNINAATEEEIRSGGDQMYRYYYCDVLAFVRTPESLQALGDLLFDVRDPWKDLPGSDTFPPRATAFYAVQSLHKMRLKNPPVPDREYDEDVAAWQRWYQEIRDGKRTFSFTGDDKVYTLAGPLQTGAVDPAPQAATALAPGAERTTGQGRVFWAALVAVIGGGVAAVMWRRRSLRIAGNDGMGSKDKR